jgi:ABC-type multidrug transport system fused ATPase/permease subunit
MQNKEKENENMPKVFPIFSMIIIGFIFVSGLLNAIYPKKMWEIFEGWKAAREPSKTFFVLRRIAGILAMLIVFAMFLFPYLMSVMNR